MIKSAIKISLMSGLVLSACVSTAKDLPKAESKEASAAETAPKVKKGCMPSPEALDSLLLTVQEARKSGDMEKMMAALALAEIHIGEMKEHKKKCKGMMEDMMNEETKTAPSGHEKHH